MGQLVKPDKKWMDRHLKTKSKYKEIVKQMKTIDKNIIQIIKGK